MTRCAVQGHESAPLAARAGAAAAGFECRRPRGSAQAQEEGCRCPQNTTMVRGTPSTSRAPCTWSRNKTESLHALPQRKIATNPAMLQVLPPPAPRQTRSRQAREADAGAHEAGPQHHRRSAAVLAAGLHALGPRASPIALSRAMHAASGVCSRMERGAACDVC